MSKTDEFNPGPASWPVRAYYTPVSDALRGKLSGRLDMRRVIAAAGLPAPLANLVYQVVHRSRLWHSEKLDVARELCAHFDDGLATGRSVEQLIADFGDPKLAARLIHQAKLRNRPLWWQTYFYISRALLAALAVGLLIYAALMLRFFLTRPSVSHNYWNEINVAREAPDDERAWPIYREAAIKLGIYGKSQFYLSPEDRPGGKRWIEVVAAIEKHRESLELARQGAQKQKLGLYFGEPADRDAARIAGTEWFTSIGGPLADENAELLTVPLGSVNAIQGLAWMLDADAQRAAIAGDGTTAMADLTAIITMSEQLYQPSVFLVEQMISLSLFEIATRTACSILAESSDIFSDLQLVALAHRLAIYRNGDFAIDLSAERLLFADVLQRTFSDDGQGSGRITPEGLAFFQNLLGKSLPMAANVSNRAAFYTLGTGAGELVADRAENQRLYDSLVGKLTAAYQGPPWHWDQEVFRGSHTEEFDMTFSSRRKVLQFLPVAFLFPGLHHELHNLPQRAMQQRDALQVAIALVLWHRRHGNWPEKLDQLVPDLLPAVPPDRFDGQPLRYIVRDGRPLLYSIGVDRRDDGGKPPEQADGSLSGRFGKMAPESLEYLRAGSMNVGDWILWPPLPPKSPDE